MPSHPNLPPPCKRGWGGKAPLPPCEIGPAPRMILTSCQTHSDQSAFSIALPCRSRSADRISTECCLEVTAQAQLSATRRGGGGLGSKSLCTSNGPDQKFVLSHDGHFGLEGGGGSRGGGSPPPPPPPPPYGRSNTPPGEQGASQGRGPAEVTEARGRAGRAAASSAGGAVARCRRPRARHAAGGGLRGARRSGGGERPGGGGGHLAAVSAGRRGGCARSIETSCRR